MGASLIEVYLKGDDQVDGFLKKCWTKRLSTLGTSTCSANLVI